jgi:hypothetical protein
MFTDKKPHWTWLEQDTGLSMYLSRANLTVVNGNHPTMGWLVDDGCVETFNQIRVENSDEQDKRLA